MWRHDINRSGATTHRLPTELNLHWARRMPALTPCWEDPVNIDRMPFDQSYEPIVVGSTLFMASNRSNCVIALDVITGKEKWRSYVGGPIRFPCVAWNGGIYFTSDDGHLYCVDQTNGKIRWQFRGAPTGQHLLGNGRMISPWPARGGVVIADGIAYFAAGIWPSMGVFIYAIDAKTGKEVWLNDGLSTPFTPHPHKGSMSFGLITPQGAMAVVGDRLLVPGGRTLPACLDRKTGKLLYFNYGEKGQGTSQICASEDVFLNYRSISTAMFSTATGQFIEAWNNSSNPVLANGRLFIGGNSIRAYDLTTLKQEGMLKPRPKRRKKRWRTPGQWQARERATGDLIKAGDRLYGGDKGRVFALDLKGKRIWEKKIEGTVDRLVAAADRLLVVTREGGIYAFGADKPEPREYQTQITRLAQTAQKSAVTKMLAQVSINRGVCLTYDASFELLAELLHQSELLIVAVEQDAAKVDDLRRRFDRAGVYGRISIHQGTVASFQAPQYVAAITIYRGARFAEGEVQSLYRSIRPYGGIAYISVKNAADLVNQVKALKLAGAEVTMDGSNVIIQRRGALAGSDDWTHKYGNVANTIKSDDTLVKPPFGVLWFGGSTHMDVLPRHGHGPPEQILGGRLIIEGINMLSARDVYTGIPLWKRQFDDLGTFGVYYDKSYRPNPLDTSYNQKHLPGSNARGTNYVVTPDAIYLLKGTDCLVLDPATGKTKTKFQLPKQSDGKLPKWGYIGVYQDLLIATATPLGIPIDPKKKTAKPPQADLRFAQDIPAANASRTIVVLNRQTGKALWIRQAELNFRHNTIAAGNGVLYCLDSMTAAKQKFLKQKGIDIKATPRLLALDILSGKEIWSDKETVFGTWISYSSEHNLIIQSGRAATDMVRDERSDRVAAYHGKTGKLLWDTRNIQYRGAPILHRNAIYFDATGRINALELLTGKPLTVKNQITGHAVPWKYQRYYGCNHPVGSEHILTFRSGTAAFCDPSTGATGNLGGFKSGCTSNLIAAGGVLNAPDYTRTCTCNYQNQTSLAFVHMPEMELWTYTALRTTGEIRRCGFNLGAPGDRVADNGTLWLDYPDAGSPSPRIPVTTKGQLTPYIHHSAFFRSKGAPPWIGASGLAGEGTINIDPGTRKPSKYTVTLYFCEPDAEAAGARVFDVILQGSKVLKSFDIASVAGSKACIKKTFKGVQSAGGIKLQLISRTGKPIISGIEMVRE